MRSKKEKERRPGTPNKPTNLQSLDSRIKATPHEKKIQRLIVEFCSREKKLSKKVSMEDTLKRFIAFLNVREFDIVFINDLVTVPYRYLVFSSKLH